MSDEASILGLLRDFAESYANHDFEALSALFAHDDQVVFYGTQENLYFIGWPAVGSSMKRQFDLVEQAKVTFRETVVRTLVEGGAAVVATLVDMSAVIDGNVVDVKGIRATYALERKEGRWRIAHMHWSRPRAEVFVEH